LIIVLS